MTEPSGEDPILRAEAQVHVALPDGRAFSLSVVRHSGLSWSSLADVERRRCATVVVGDPSLPSVLHERLDREPGSRHPLVRRALGEVLGAGRLPYPDTIGEPSEIARTADGATLRIAFPDERITCELVLASRRLMRPPRVLGQTASNASGQFAVTSRGRW